MLNPVVTMPNTRPAMPGGAAARTSMSRDGMIMPPRKPAAAIATTSRITPRLNVPIAKVIAAAAPKPTAATSAWRRVASATKPPARTPIAVAIR